MIISAFFVFLISASKSKGKISRNYIAEPKRRMQSPCHSSVDGWGEADLVFIWLIKSLISFILVLRIYRLFLDFLFFWIISVFLNYFSLFTAHIEWTSHGVSISMEQEALRYLIVTSQYLLDCGVAALNIDLLRTFCCCYFSISIYLQAGLHRTYLRLTLSFPFIELNPCRRIKESAKLRWITEPEMV